MTADPVARLPFDSLGRGDVLPPFSLALSAADVRAYLQATGEPAEHWSELVPPLMLIARMIGGLLERIEIPDRLLHAGQEFEMQRALRIDEAAEIRFSVTSLGTRGGAVMASFGIDAVAEGGESVATARASVVVPPAGEGPAT